jgi:hypothetical protein
VKDFKYKFSDKYKEIAGMQVTQIKKDEEFYLKMSSSEFQIMKPYLNSPKKILELGCGLGRFSIFLNSQLEDSPHFTLADFSKISKDIKYGWNPKESVYNDLNLTKEFCIDNGLQNLSLLDLEKESLEDLEDIDLVISVLSVGFHYPIESYMSTLLNITSDDATMIFGVRSGIYDISDFKESFSNIELAKNPLVDTKEDLLILRK